MKHLLSVLLIAVLQGFNAYSQTSSWVLNGPNTFPVNISGQINGMGRVSQIKFDPNNPNTLFACSASGGLFKSTNAGNSWSPAGTDMLPRMNLASICIDHSNSNIMYLGTGDANYYSVDFGIWKTIDGGINWAPDTNGMGNLMAVEILMDPVDPYTLLAATNNGIWKTNNAGASWYNVLAGGAFTDMQWQPLSGSSVVYASTMDKFYRSADGGNIWTEITSGFGGLLYSGTRIATTPANPAYVYVVSVKDEGTIFRSTDTGYNFNIQYHNPAWSIIGYDSATSGQGNYNLCLEAHPVNPNQLFLGSHNIMRSDDGGVTWQKLTHWSKIVHTDMHDWAFQPGNPLKLFQANDGGVWLTMDSGVSWQPKNDGLAATENYHAAASPLYSGLLSSGTQDNGEMVHLNNTWKTNRGGDWTTLMQMDYSTQKFIYYFTDKNRRPLPSGGSNAYGVPASITAGVLKQAFSPDNQDLGYLTGNALWQCRNLGSSSPVWTAITPSVSTIRAVATCVGHPNIVAYYYSNKYCISHNALDAAPSFTTYTLSVTGNKADIFLSGKDTNLVYLILNTRVYRSVDGGLTFVDYTGSLPSIDHMKIFPDDYSGNESVYVGNALGVYYRNKTMSDWVNYSGALPTIAGIRDIMYFNDGGVDARLYVSYFGRGIWETKLENPHACTTPVIAQTHFNGSDIELTWNNTGASQYDVQYRAVGTVDWMKLTSNSPLIKISSYGGCAEYEFRVRSRCAGDSSLWSTKTYLSTPTNPLNNDFDNHQDIGTVGAAGSVCYDAVNQRYTINASGDDIWNDKDQFHFLYRKMDGDITISARVKHIGNIYGWAKGGVMIRETLNTSSKHSMCVLTPGNGFANQWRSATGGNSSNVDTAGTEPGWVKLERLGNDFNAYFSVDGINWQLFNTVTIAMTDSVYVGLANCSHIDSTLNDAVFDHIEINGTALTVNNVATDASPVSLYPNPAGETLTIHLQGNTGAQQVTVRVYDATGRKLLQETSKWNGSEHQLPVTSLPPGAYVIEVLGRQRHVSRFIKQ